MGACASRASGEKDGLLSGKSSGPTAFEKKMQEASKARAEKAAAESPFTQPGMAGSLQKAEQAVPNDGSTTESKHRRGSQLNSGLDNIDAAALVEDEDEDDEQLTYDDIKDRLECGEQRTIPLGKDSGLSLRYAYVCGRGIYPHDPHKNNQDAFKVIPNFNGDPEQLFLGVFDGHGEYGDDCSYFVRDNIEKYLQRLMIKNPNDFMTAYKRTFKHINHSCHKQARLGCSLGAGVGMEREAGGRRQEGGGGERGGAAAQCLCVSPPRGMRAACGFIAVRPLAMLGAEG